MDKIFTEEEIDRAIAGCQTFLNSGLLDQPEIIQGVKENMDLSDEMRKTLNLLENVRHWMGLTKKDQAPEGIPDK